MEIPPSPRSTWRRPLAALLASCLLLVTAATAQADQRQHRLRWIPVPQADEYRAYLGASSGTYTQVISLQGYQVDAQGTAHFDLTLETDRAYFIALTSVKDALESSLSNEVYLSPLLCPADRQFCYSVSFNPRAAESM